MTFKSFDSWTARILVVLTFLGAIYTCIHYVVKAEVSDLSAKVGTANTNIAQLKESISKIDGDIKKTNDRIDEALNHALDKLVSGKGAAAKGSELLEKGQTILAIAKSIDAKLAPDSLVGYGKLVSTLTSSPSLSNVAWRNLAQAMNYRSFLNADYAPKPSDLAPATGREGYKFSLNLVPDRPENSHIPGAIVCTAGGYAPPEQSARLERYRQCK
jgi:hypothetical protein